ncbi:MAG: iron complex outermembrane receptor protein [Kiritimatiellia bacterium]|jgi:iron complex outermembrane receptor protein
MQFLTSATCALWLSLCLSPILVTSEPIPADLTTVIVTAEKREADMEKLPIAMSHLDFDRLSSGALHDLEALKFEVPGLQLGHGTADTKIAMRGIRNSSELVTLGADTAVAMHADGVYLARSHAARINLFDVERIEVLRGPQSTLYGRNAIGGAINVIPVRPTAERDAYLRLGYGSYDRILVEGAAGGTVAENLFGRISFQHDQQDGYGDNLFNGSNYEDENHTAFRGQLTLAPHDRAELRLSAHYFTLDQVQSVYTDGTVSGRPTTAELPPFNGSLATGKRNVNQNTRAFDEREFYGAAATLELQYPTHLLRSITAFEQMDVHNLTDTDDTEVNQLVFDDRQEAQQFSEELQLISQYEGRFNYILGLNLFHEEMDELAVLTFSPAPGVQVPLSSKADFETDALSFYMQLDHAINERLKLSVGGRYNYDEKQFKEKAAVPTPFTNDTDESWDAFPWKISLAYQADQATQVYVSTATGFKSGGFNLNQGPNTQPYDQEDLITYEAGVKSRLSEKLQANLAFFTSVYEDIQLASIETASVVINNGADADIHGIEAEFIAKASDALTLYVNGTWLDSAFQREVQVDSGNLGAGPQNLKGNQLPQTPEFSVNTGITYSQQLPDNNGLVRTRLDYSWRDEVFFTQFNHPALADGATGHFNAFITYMTPSHDWQLQLYGKNLTDEESVSNAISSSSLAGFPVRTFLDPPRTVGVTATRFF